MTISADPKGLKSWFKKYVAEVCAGLHDRDLAAIFLKEQHTYRVMKDIRLIAQSLDGMTAEGLRLAETIALLHDVGRFVQWRDHRTFVDSQSTDHASLGLEVLTSRGVLGDLPPEESAVIEEAIRYHNTKDVPEKLAPRAMLFTRLIRDADKLDIWRVVTDHVPGENDILDRLVFGEMPSAPSFSKEILGSLLRGDKSDMRFAKTQNDLKLLRIGWMYDVSFEKTRLEILKRNYVEKIIGQLPDYPEIRELHRYVVERLRRPC